MTARDTPDIRSAACHDRPGKCRSILDDDTQRNGTPEIMCRRALFHPAPHRDGGVSWVRSSDGAVVWVDKPEGGGAGE